MKIKVTDSFISDVPFEVDFESFVALANRGEGEGVIEQGQDETKNMIVVVSRLLTHLIESNVISIEKAVELAQPYGRYILAKPNV